MKKFVDIDLISNLKKIMESNTVAYRSDFDVDIECIKRASVAESKHDKNLVWLSRRNGTHCNLEKNVFIKNTAEYNTWQFWADTHKDEKYLAFAIKVKGVEDGIIKGDLYELDYLDFAEHIKTSAVPMIMQIAHYEKADELVGKDEEIDYSFKAERGNFLSKDYVVPNIETLEDILDNCHNQYDNYKKGDITKYIDSLYKKPSVRDKLKNEKIKITKQHKKPNKVTGKTNEIEV